MITPLRDYILIELVEKKSNEVGLIIPEEKKKDKGIVKAVSDEMAKKICVGDRVVFTESYIIEDEGVKLHLVKEENIIAKIN